MTLEIDWICLRCGEVIEMKLITNNCSRCGWRRPPRKTVEVDGN